MRIDVIGDIHGELPAMHALGRLLGYDVANGWAHPEGRVPVFLGDLVDRGAHSLEVAEEVQRIVESGRGACLMGNHEYNLVAWKLQLPGYRKLKRSNAPTIAAMKGFEARWEKVFPFLRGLPIAFALPELRIIHASWHTPSYRAVRELLEPKGRSDAGGALRDFVALETPFTETGLKAGLHPWDDAVKIDAPHELLMKGFEVDAPAPFKDSEGVERTMQRATWWLDADDQVLRDRPTVMGHYWHLPPIDGLFCPPHPSGHPELRAWGTGVIPRLPPSGMLPATGNAFCVDFNGVTAAREQPLACVGALRWPERQIAWATAPRTRTEFGHD